MQAVLLSVPLSLDHVRRHLENITCTHANLHSKRDLDSTTITANIWGELDSGGRGFLPSFLSLLLMFNLHYKSIKMGSAITHLTETPRVSNVLKC